jgi:signal transduction histidine kinase
LNAPLIGRSDTICHVPGLLERTVDVLNASQLPLQKEMMSLPNQTTTEPLTQSDKRIKALEQQALDLARSVETVRRQTLAESNERIEALEQKARDLAWFVETTRQKTLLQSDKKIEALEQKARDLANFVESMRNQTRLQSETEIEALGQQARDLALFVESVRTETRLQSETEIAALGQQAKELAVSVETMREETLLQSDTEIQELNQRARNVARSVEESRLATLLESDKVTRKLNEELEQRVLERTAQLEAANKELESFSYSISHDLRAPLRAIAGFSRILLDDYFASLPEEAQTYLKLVDDNTHQMSELVDDLLAFSRLGRQALTKHTVDPGKIVRLCLVEMEKDQEDRQVEIIIEDMPSCQADPNLLKQVWTNLLSNALKYTGKREAARIVIGCKMAPRPSGTGIETVYYVEDNGAGFDMKYAHKLFGVFQRLHRAADYEGTGVGLAIVQRIVTRHGGRVWAEAQLNQGATFSFTLES